MKSEDNSLDWYALSRIELEKPNIDKFKSIIANANISLNIETASTIHRKRLLIMFQNAQQMIKNEDLILDNAIVKAKMWKSQKATQIAKMENQTQLSYQQLMKMKAIIDQKKKTITKYKEKINKKAKEGNSNSQTYYCPFCGKNTFETKEIFTFHMYSEHQIAKTVQNNSFSSNTVNNELKQFITTLKDKQMELFSMIMKQKKEMQAQELQKLYEFQLNKIKRQTHYLSKQDDDCEELQGQSQFLFYHKSDLLKREIQSDKQIKMKEAQRAKSRKSIQTDLQKQFYQKENSKQTQSYGQNYFQILNDIESDRSLVESPQKNQERELPNLQSGPKIQKLYYPEDKSISSLNFKKYPIEVVHPSISNRLQHIGPQIMNREYDSRLDSMYAQKWNHQHEQNYIFNSGPLFDDKGGDSDYQDYFQQRKQEDDNDIIEDQQIKMPNFQLMPHFQSKPNPNVSNHKDNDVFSLISPKNSEQRKSQNSILQKLNQLNTSNKFDKDKSSEIIDLSDSFSKKDFDISKDQSSINLSDLKLSKLQKQKSLNRPKNIHKTQKNQNQQIQKQQSPAIIGQKEFLLDLNSNYGFQKMRSDELNRFKKAQPISLKATRQNAQLSNSNGILDEFFKKEYLQTSNKSQNNAKPLTVTQLQEFMYRRQ